MREHTDFEELDEHTKWLVRFKAQQLVGQYGFTRSDVDDIEQELTIHVLLRLAGHEPSRGARTTYVESVLNNKIRNMICDERQSLGRDYRLVGKSLDEPVVGRHGVVFGDTLSWNCVNNGSSRLTEAEQSDLRMELSRALAAMTPEMREVCIRLPDTKIVDLAREMGVPRHRILWLRERVRQILIKFRLDEYLC